MQLKSWPATLVSFAVLNCWPTNHPCIFTALDNSVNATANALKEIHPFSTAFPPLRISYRYHNFMILRPTIFIIDTFNIIEDKLEFRRLVRPIRHVWPKSSPSEIGGNFVALTLHVWNVHYSLLVIVRALLACSSNDSHRYSQGRWRTVSLLLRFLFSWMSEFHLVVVVKEDDPVWQEIPSTSGRTSIAAWSRLNIDASRCRRRTSYHAFKCRSVRKLFPAER